MHQYEVQSCEILFFRRPGSEHHRVSLLREQRRPNRQTVLRAKLQRIVQRSDFLASEPQSGKPQEIHQPP